MKKSITHFVTKQKDKSKKIKRKEINRYTIRRLSLYLSDLKRLEDSGIQVISSSKIPEILDVSSAQFRKDLSYFGEFGKRGVGYKVDSLVREIENILGTNRVWDIALIGVGRLGGALLSYPGFRQFNLHISAVFDNNRKKIGKIYNGIKVDDIRNFRKIVNARKIKIAMLCIPQNAVEGALRLIKNSSIRAILNFTPFSLKMQNAIFVSNVNMSSELQTLTFFLKNTRK